MKVAARLQYPINIGYVLDGSESMKDYFDSTKEFSLAYFIEETGSNNITNVGVVLSSAEPILAIPMSPPSPKSKFIDGFDNMKYPGKTGRLDSALKMAADSLFQQDKANEILIVITDGVQVNQREALFEQSRELHRRGVSVYVISIGEVCDFDVLRNIAGDEKRVRLLESGEELTRAKFVKEFAESTRGTQGNGSFVF